MANLKVNIAGVEFKNPIITASGCSDSVGNMRRCIRWKSWAVCP